MGFPKFESVPLAEIEAKNLVADTSPVGPVVLVVDDEPLIADTIATILNIAGYAATSAYSGERAFELARIVPPELLISDVSMPGGMNGVELAIAIKTLVPDCKTLLFSGNASQSELLANAREAGHNFNILQKPVPPHILLARISQLTGVDSQNMNEPIPWRQEASEVSPHSSFND